MTLDDYILAHIDPEPEYLHRLWRATHLHLNYPRMASGHLQGAVLRMLTHMVRPRNVLEIGTFTGYSTLCIASALEPGALIHTIEINDEQEDFTRPWLENSPWADRIRFYIGDALEMLDPLRLPLWGGEKHAPKAQQPSTLSPQPQPSPPRGESERGQTLHPTGGVGEGPNPTGGVGEGLFDLVFIDADKRHYVDYYRTVLPRVRPGGYILADNTLWDGHVVSENSEQPGMAPAAVSSKEAQTCGIIAFNDLVAADTRVQRVILPLRDGLTIIRKRPAVHAEG